MICPAAGFRRDHVSRHALALLSHVSLSWFLQTTPGPIRETRIGPGVSFRLPIRKRPQSDDDLLMRTNAYERRTEFAYHCDNGEQARSARPRPDSFVNPPCPVDSPQWPPMRSGTGKTECSCRTYAGKVQLSRKVMDSVSFFVLAVERRLHGQTIFRGQPIGDHRNKRTLALLAV